MSTVRNSVSSALALLFLLSTPSPLFSQEITAAISGLVTDATGSAVDQDRGTSWKTITDKDGRYDLPRLPVGTYKVAVEQRGFQRTEQGGVHVVLNQTA